jgi:hypothetical protein
VRRWRLVIALVLSACASKPPPVEPASPSASASSSQAPPPLAAETQTSGKFPDRAVPSLVGEDRTWHARALEAVAAKDWHQAKRILLRLVAGYRKEKLFGEQYEWVQQRLDAEQSPASDAMKKAKVEAVPALPPSFRSARSASVPARPIPKLSIKKSTANGIGDEDRWFHEAGPLSEIALPAADTFFVLHIDLKDRETDRVLQSLLLGGWLPDAPQTRLRNVPFPAWIPPSFGTAPLGRVLVSDPYTLLVYGDRYLFVFDRERALVRAIDLFLWLYPESHIARNPIKVGELRLTTAEGTTTGDLTVADRGPRHDLRWAQARDGILYVSTSYNGYAKEVKGQTAFVMALDLGTGDVLFRSPALTANAQNFVLVDGVVVAGYGFTAEPDFVYALDAATGKTLQRLSVPSSPEHFAWNAERREVLVRTYDHDVVLAVSRP